MFRFDSNLPQPNLLQPSLHGKKGEPFYTPAEGNGWGMFQRDATGDSAHPVTIDEVWNWKTNVGAGIAELQREKQLASDYFAAVKRTYSNQWEEPPATYTPPGTSTSMSYMEAAIMTLYNGASVIQKLTDPDGVHKSLYLSCWQFLPNNTPGNRWQFKVNKNNYVYQVIHNEYEGHLQTVE